MPPSPVCGILFSSLIYISSREFHTRMWLQKRLLYTMIVKKE